MYGSDPLGVLSWRFLVDQAGHGVTTDLHEPLGRPRAHAARADHARGRDDGDVHPRAPAARRGAGTPLRPRRARRPDRRGHQRGLRRDAVRVRLGRARHVRGEPLDRRPREPDRRSRSTAPRARSAGTSRSSTSCSSTSPRTSCTRATGPCSAATASPTTATSCPGSANGIGFEDLVVIEDYEFCRVGRRGPRAPRRASATRSTWVSVQAALLRSAQSGRWEDVVSLREE